ncbi:MAG: UDP-N-acetylmuramate--L-alanine ligase [Tannerella sp.]|jgi:UDP-N-acetylmuramate--alanine ligase|nr:UDP-N-acetylmuramate--L-alanine ligase [Tannerella sp.]
MNDVKNIYFVGAGGIGMSALIRYFLSKGKIIAGYDRTPSELTAKLIREGADIHYVEDEKLIPPAFRDKNSTLVVYTPAVPNEHAELQYFRQNGFEILKRSQVLGLISESSRGLCFAGTHGKTTTSSMAAHLLKQSTMDCNAFLGGILKNYHSNMLLSEKSDLTVLEADEYDRSFHYLKPYMAVITSADPDHLDIYGTPEAYRESFEHFTSLVRPGGAFFLKKGVQITPRLQENVRLYTYSLDDKTADFHADNIKIGNGEIVFDFVSPTLRVEDVQLGVPLRINIENAVAAMAVASLNGVTADEMRDAMKSFAGAERRFDFKVKTAKTVYIDDYAHHPEELRNSILSVRELYPDRKITGIFQPHLYTRTRDFAVEFAEALSLFDELILLDIYPAREEPIPGVTSQIIFDRVTIPDKTLCKKENLMKLIENKDFDVLMTLGAGDIDRFVKPIAEMIDKTLNPEP